MKERLAGATVHVSISGGRRLFPAVHIVFYGSGCEISLSLPVTKASTHPFCGSLNIFQTMGNLINGLHPNLALPSSSHALCSLFLLYPVEKYKNENGVHNRSLLIQRYTKPINTFQNLSKGKCESLEKREEMAKELEILLDLLCSCEDFYVMGMCLIFLHY